MRRLATIRTVSGIRPIEGADRIVVAQIDGWECVVKKGEFDVGEKVVYVEVDSIMPEKPEFEFLRDKRFRVRTIRLRGQISQGLVLPLSVLPDGDYRVDDDVTRILGIRKYDPQAEQERLLISRNELQKSKSLFTWFTRFRWFRRMFAKSKRKGGFPEWIVKTDEERIQNKTAMFEIEKKLGTLFTVTEKLDGQSATYYLQKRGRKRYDFGVCSRNVLLKKADSSSYWTIAQRLNLEKILGELIGDNDRIVLQGEIIGPGIQKNKYDLKEYDFYAFNLIVQSIKINTLNMPSFLSAHGIKTVPVIYEDAPLNETVSAMVDNAKGNSIIMESQKREGLVWRNYARNVSFKVINPDFLLAEDA